MLLALSSAATTLKAQTEKGTQTLGGTIGVSTSKNTVDMAPPSSYTPYSYILKTTTFSIGPNYSYFVANKLDLGASLGYSYQNMKFFDEDVLADNPEKVKTQSFLAEVYLRKYFLYDNKIGIRTGPFVAYQYGKSTNSLSDIPNVPNVPYSVPQKSTTVAGGVLLDFVYFPYKKVGLAASMGSLSYTHQDSKEPSYNYKSTTDSFGFNFFSSVNFSVFYAFGK